MLANRGQNKIVFPFFLYVDDFEINNPLEPHCDPLLVVYLSFPTSPLEYHQMFCAALFKSSHIKSLK